MSKSEMKRLGVLTKKIPLSEDIGRVAHIRYLKQGITRGKLLLWEKRAKGLEEDVEYWKDKFTRQGGDDE